MKMAANAIPRTMTRGKLERVALVAVLGGATGIGFAPILVRLSETGPSATAGLRVLFALPLLWMMANVQRRKQPSAVQPTSRPRPDGHKHRGEVGEQGGVSHAGEPQRPVPD